MFQRSKIFENIKKILKVRKFSKKNCNFLVQILKAKKLYLNAAIFLAVSGCTWYAFVSCNIVEKSTPAGR